MAIAEIIGPSGLVHYRRPPNDPMVQEARETPGYSVRLVECTCAKPHYTPMWWCAEHGEVVVPMD